MLEKGAEHLPEPLTATVGDPLALNDAVSQLRHYSFIEVGDGSWSVHRLVQGVVRDRLDDTASTSWAGAAIGLIDDAFPSDIATNPASWPTCAHLLPHALAVAVHAESMHVSPKETGHLLNQVGIYLLERAEYVQSKAVMERSIAIGETDYGPDHPDVATRLHNLGQIMQDLGDFDGARNHIQRALDIHEKTYGPDDPTVATGRNNLGDILRAQGDLAGAQHQLQRALAIDEKTPSAPTITGSASASATWAASFES